MITKVMVRKGTVHDCVYVWTRGTRAGSMIVDSGDGLRVAGLLLSRSLYKLTKEGTEYSYDVLKDRSE